MLTFQDSLYTDHDISDYVNVMLAKCMGGYREHHTFLLRGIGDDKLPDDDERVERCYVLVTPAIDTKALALPIDYFFDKTKQPESCPAELLSQLEDHSELFNPEHTDEARAQIINNFVVGQKIDNDVLQFLIRTVNGCGNQRALQERILELQKRTLKKDLFEELMPLLMKETESRARILFPYNITQSHWLTCEIKIHKEEGCYHIACYAHDPYGGGKLQQVNVEPLQLVLLQRITAFDNQAKIQLEYPKSPYKQRQAFDDKISCGVIVAEDILKRAAGSTLNVQQPYAAGAYSLRKKHINNIKKLLPENDATSINFIKRHCRLPDEDFLPNKISLGEQSLKSVSKQSEFLKDNKTPTKPMNPRRNVVQQPSSPYLRAFRKFIQEKDCSSAVTYFESLLKQHTGDMEVYWLLGHAYIMNKQYKEAIDTFNKAQQQLTSSHDLKKLQEKFTKGLFRAYSEYAKFLIDKEQYELAIKNFAHVNCIGNLNTALAMTLAYSAEKDLLQQIITLIEQHNAILTEEICKKISPAIKKSMLDRFAKNGNEACFKILIQCGASPDFLTWDVVTENIRTLLRYRAGRSQPSIYQYSQRRNKEPEKLKALILDYEDTTESSSSDSDEEELLVDRASLAREKEKRIAQTKKYNTLHTKLREYSTGYRENPTKITAIYIDALIFVSEQASEFKQKKQVLLYESKGKNINIIAHNVLSQEWYWLFRSKEGGLEKINLATIKALSDAYRKHLLSKDFHAINTQAKETIKNALNGYLEHLYTKMQRIQNQFRYLFFRGLHWNTHQFSCMHRRDDRHSAKCGQPTLSLATQKQAQLEDKLSVDESSQPLQDAHAFEMQFFQQLQYENIFHRFAEQYVQQYGKLFNGGLFSKKRLEGGFEHPTNDNPIISLSHKLSKAMNYASGKRHRNYEKRLNPHYRRFTLKPKHPHLGSISSYCIDHEYYLKNGYNIISMMIDHFIRINYHYQFEYETFFISMIPGIYHINSHLFSMPALTAPKWKDFASENSDIWSRDLKIKFAKIDEIIEKIIPTKEKNLKNSVKSNYLKTHPQALFGRPHPKGYIEKALVPPTPKNRERYQHPSQQLTQESQSYDDWMQLSYDEESDVPLLVQNTRNPPNRSELSTFSDTDQQAAIANSIKDLSTLAYAQRSGQESLNGDWLSQGIDASLKESSKLEEIPKREDAFLFDHIKTILEKYFLNNRKPVHGPMHACRVAIWVKLIYNLYLKQLPTLSTSLHNINITLLQISAIFHDVAREKDIGRDCWDAQSAEICFDYFKNTLSLSQSEANLYRNAIKKKDKNFEGKTLLKKIIHDADALDIMRVKKKFKIEKLDIYKDLQTHKHNPIEILMPILSQIRDFISVQGDMKVACAIYHNDGEISAPVPSHFDQTTKAQYENNVVNCFEATLAVLDKYTILNDYYNHPHANVFMHTEKTSHQPQPMKLARTREHVEPRMITTTSNGHANFFKNTFSVKRKREHEKNSSATEQQLERLEPQSKKIRLLK